MSLQKKFSKSKKACNVTFSLPTAAADGCLEVKLLGDFNQWERETALALKQEDGVFTGSLDLEPGQEYQFRYLIDGQVWENDWEADKYVPSPYGGDNSVVVVPTELAK